MLNFMNKLWHCSHNGIILFLMIKFVRGLACLVLLCLMAACKNDSEDVGMSIRPQADQIILGSDTFHVVSQDFLADAI